jgi:hypothetical protein
MVNVPDSGVKAPHATKAGGQGNLSHGQSCFIDEFLGEMETPGLSNRIWRRPQMLDEQAT